MAKHATKSEAKELRSIKIQQVFDGKRAPRALGMPKRLLKTSGAFWQGEAVFA